MSVREEEGKGRFDLGIEPLGLITSRITDEEIEEVRSRRREEIAGQQEEWQGDESPLLRSRIRL